LALLIGSISLIFAFLAFNLLIRSRLIKEEDTQKRKTFGKKLLKAANFFIGTGVFLFILGLINPLLLQTYILVGLNLIFLGVNSYFIGLPINNLETKNDKLGEIAYKIAHIAKWIAIILIVVSLLMAAWPIIIDIIGGITMETSDILMIIFTGVIAIFTFFYSICSWQLTKETRKARKTQTEPLVCIYLSPRESWIAWIDLTIENIGIGPAYDIHFTLSNNNDSNEDYKLLSQMSCIQNGISFLAPSQKIKTFFTSLAEYNKENISPINVKITYKNIYKEEYSSEYTINLSELLGIQQLGEPPLEKIAKNIEIIKSDIHSISHDKEINVITQTKKQKIESDTVRIKKAVNKNK
jgi:hypothetical protein